MTEMELSKFGLLEEFAITELEQRLEFEAWYDGNSFCPTNPLCQPLETCPPDNAGCGELNEGCVIE